MKTCLKLIPCLLVFASQASFAATAWLKSQQEQGLRTVCIYEADGRTKTVTLPLDRECPAESEIDLFSFSRGDSGNRKRKAIPTETGKVLSGELVRGSSKSCAYRDGQGKARYRTVSADAPCPAQHNW